MANQTSRISRRSLFKIGAGGGAAAAAFGCAAGASPQAASAFQAPASGRPKNIIFLVSDGMSISVPSMTDVFSRIVRGRGTVWGDLMRERRSSQGLFETHSLNGIVTDSAAASTAWGSGSRVFNGSVNVLPDGTEMKPILRVLKDEGFMTGLVTTARVTHATPAGFASVVPNRGMEDEIAPQYLGVVDVILGGGKRHYAPDRRRIDNNNITQQYRDAGYRIWESRSDLFNKMAVPEKVLGLFSDSHVPYEVDRLNSPELLISTPSLAEMTDAALRTLARADKGFMLQVEGARIDHAGHGNDAVGMIWDQVAFDDAVGAALRFAEGRNDTLVVITSDHGTGGPSLNGFGDGYLGVNDGFALLEAATGSYSAVYDALRDTSPTAESFRETIHGICGVLLDPEEAEASLAAYQNDAPYESNGLLRSFTSILGQSLGNHTGVQFTGSNHTEDCTLISALGPGQELFGGFVRNTDFFDISLELLGVEYENPSITPEESRRYAFAQPRVRDFEGVA